KTPQLWHHMVVPRMTRELDLNDEPMRQRSMNKGQVRDSPLTLKDKRASKYPALIFGEQATQCFDYLCLKIGLKKACGVDQLKNVLRITRSGHQPLHALLQDTSATPLKASSSSFNRWISGPLATSV